MRARPDLSPLAVGAIEAAVNCCSAKAGPGWSDPTWHPRIAGLAVLFLRAVLEGDGAARAKLAAGAPALLAAGDRLETRGFGRD